jgi:hypothetical protein
VIKRVLLALVLTALPAIPQIRKADSTEGSLAKTVIWSPLSERLFSDDPHVAAFSLKTSWIPGEGHKGMLRYQIAVTAEDMTPSEIAGYPHASSKQEFLKRISSCGIQLRLSDSEGFIVRKTEVVLDYVTDRYSQVDALNANGATQMNAAESE